MDIVAILAIKVVLLVLVIGGVYVIVALMDIIFNLIQLIAMIPVQFKQHIKTK